MDGGDGNIKKSITIHSTSLSGNGSLKGKKTRNKTARKIRPSSIVQPSVLKKTLLERIKQHQRTRERGREKDDNHLDGSGTGSGTGTNNQSSSSNNSKAGRGLSEVLPAPFSIPLYSLYILSKSFQKSKSILRLIFPDHMTWGFPYNPL